MFKTRERASGYASSSAFFYPFLNTGYASAALAISCETLPNKYFL